MPKIIDKPVKRFFAFGCSFTNYEYPTWADIIAYDLEVDFYNYAKSGAGNQYIFNTIMQADSFYNFNEDDLIIVQWSSVSREDRYKDSKWITPGNIYTQATYDSKYVAKWANFEGYLIRDFALIKAASEFLQNKKIQYHTLSMAPLATTYNQWENSVQVTQHISNMINLYKSYLDKILPSFYQVLWNGSIQHKVEEENRLYSKMVNCHPTVLEHYKFLLQTFDHTFNETTVDIVNKTEQKYQHIMNTTNFAKVNFHDIDFSDLFFIKSQDIKQL